MQLVNLLLLDSFKRTHPDSRGPLNQWQIEVERAGWKSTQDIKARYPSASVLPDNKIIFNIKGNKYRLVVKVKYLYGIVFIEWVGTHADYDKKKF